MDATIPTPPPLPVPWPAAPPRLPERPGYLLTLAVLWSLGAMCAAVVVAALLGVASKLRLGNKLLADPRVIALLTTAALGLVLLAVARWQARTIGHGDVRRGLGAGPIRRPWLLLALAALTVVAPSIWIVSLQTLLHPKHQAEGVTELVRASTSLGPGIQLATWFVMVALAPVAEELFFRGWLWTGLRRRWGLVGVVVGTSAPWLVMHMPDGALRPLFLLPAALLFSLAREYCGGVWASLTLHLVNNAVSVGVLTLMLQSGT